MSFCARFLQEVKKKSSIVAGAVMALFVWVLEKLAGTSSLLAWFIPFFTIGILPLIFLYLEVAIKAAIREKILLRDIARKVFKDSVDHVVHVLASSVYYYPTLLTLHLVLGV